MKRYNDFYQYWGQDDQILVNNNQDFNNEGNIYDNFIIGNGFPNSYIPYKNYQPAELNPENDKEYMMLMLQIYDFAAHELTLYLDTHPEDQQAISKRQEFVALTKEAQNNYEKKYGALTLSSNNLNTSPWQWATTKFPWEVM